MLKQLITGLMFFNFIATVRIPLGGVQVYKNVVRVETVGNADGTTSYYVLRLDNSKEVYVPIIFTIIEEK